MVFRTLPSFLPAGVSASVGCLVLAVPSLRLRVSESSSLSAWSFPFRGLSPFLAFVPLLEALSESLTHSLLLGVSLVRFCGGLC